MQKTDIRMESRKTFNRIEAIMGEPFSENLIGRVTLIDRVTGYEYSAKEICEDKFLYQVLAGMKCYGYSYNPTSETVTFYIS